MTDRVIRGGAVVLAELEEPLYADIAISNGKVEALAAPGTIFEGAEELDVTNRVVTPGAVDPHVHVSWPYLDSRTLDDYQVATRAAVHGGTTTIIDFAIEQRDDPVAAISARRAQAEGAAVCDYSFHLVVSTSQESTIAALPAVVAEGVTSFKCYLTYRRRGLMVDDATLLAVFRAAAAAGAVVVVHAENGALEEARLAPMVERGAGSASDYIDLKPPFVEAEAVARVSRLAAAAGAQVGILHLSSEEGLRAAVSARGDCGQPARIETCPQYLLLDQNRYKGSDGHHFLCSPPLRNAPNQVALWDGLRTGDVSYVGTDHCLFSRAQKDRYRDSFWNCPHGLPGVETRSRLILQQAPSRGISLNRCVDALSTSAARWFGLYPQKGTLMPGSDADLAVWDLADRSVIASEDLHMGCDWSPYDGFPSVAPPTDVLVRGRPLIRNGTFQDAPGWGTFLARVPGAAR